MPLNDLNDLNDYMEDPQGFYQGIDTSLYRGPIPPTPPENTPLHDPNAPARLENLNFDPWTPADDLELAKLQTGMSNTSQDWTNSQIDHETYLDVMGQLDQRIQPLLAKKAKSDQMAKAAQMRDVHEQAAAAQAIQQANAVHDAQNFNRRTSTYSDPMTGDTAHFFQTEPGKWKQVEFNKDEPTKENAAKTEWTGTPWNINDVAPEDRVFGTPRDEAPWKGQPWAPVEGFEMTPSQLAIHQIALAGGGRAAKDVYEQAMLDRAAQMAGVPRDAGPNVAQRRILWDRAERTVLLPPGRERDAAVAHQFQSDVENFKREHLQKMREDMQDKKEAAIAARQDKSLEFRQNHEQTQQQRIQAIRYHTKDVKKELKEFQDPTYTGEVPGWAGSPALIKKEIKRRVADEAEIAGPQGAGPTMGPQQEPSQPTANKDQQGAQQVVEGILSKFSPQKPQPPAPQPAPVNAADRVKEVAGSLPPSPPWWKQEFPMNMFTKQDEISLPIRWMLERATKEGRDLTPQEKIQLDRGLRHVRDEELRKKLQTLTE